MGYAKQSNRNSRSPARNTSGYKRQSYIEGKAARKLETAPQRKRKPVSQNKHKANARRKQQVKVMPMNIAYMGVMTAALVVLSIVLLGYVRLQSSITLHVNNISQLESELNSLKLSNDEMYTKIMSNVDLEEIKRIAVNELGMKYAKEGQVVPYSSQGSDYVRQYSEIPSN